MKFSSTFLCVSRRLVPSLSPAFSNILPQSLDNMDLSWEEEAGAAAEGG